LKKKLIQEARRLGLHTILARVAEKSDASIRINESFGFKHVGTMKEVGLKFGRRLDVHLMQLMLDEPAESGAPSETTAGDPYDTAMADTNNVASTVLESALASFQANKGWADKAVAQLSDEKLHLALDANTNSIAVPERHAESRMIVLETERLYLREWVPDDWVRFKPLVVDPRVIQYINQGGPWPDDRIENRVRENTGGRGLRPKQPRRPSTRASGRGTFHGSLPSLKRLTGAILISACLAAF
jgi:RimJ/RimL family protein N-acetyltransferase